MSRTIVCLLAALLSAGAAAAQDAARDGWVVLPIDEYRALRARAFPAPPEPAPPPVDATITRIDYDLRLSGDTVGGEVTVSIDVIKQGWVSVRVPPGLLVREARLDGRRTPLVQGAPPSVLISRAGRSIVTLDVVVPVTASPGSESVTLPPGGSAVSEVRLTIPRTGVELSVAGGFVAERTEGASESRWTIFGTPGRPLGFTWKKKADDRRSTGPLRTRARITEIVSLNEEVSQITASIRLEVVQGAARDITLVLPEGLIVNQVQGATVGDWNQDQCSLFVSFLEPATAETAIVVSAEARTPRDGAIVIPIVRFPAAERETGGIAVDVVGFGEIAEREARGMDPADPTDLDDIVARRATPSMTAFRFKPSPGNATRTLTVTVSRYTPHAVLVANVEEARYEALATEDGKTLVRARYAVRNNQRSFLAVTLPPQSTLWSASLGGRPIRPGVSSDGGLLLPLQKGRAGQEAPAFVVEVVYVQRTLAWTEKGDARLALPAVDLPVSMTGVSLRHSPRFQIEPKPGTFRVEPDPGPHSAAFRESPVPPTAMARPAPGAEMEGSRDLKALLDRVNKDSTRTAAGVIPVTVSVPEFGPSIFFLAELTAEKTAPEIELTYRRRQ